MLTFSALRRHLEKEYELPEKVAAQTISFWKKLGWLSRVKSLAEFEEFLLRLEREGYRELEA